MAIIFACGHECRDAGLSAAMTPDEKHWDSQAGTAVPAISTTTFRTGAASMRMLATAQTSSLIKNISNTILAGRCYFNFHTLPASGTPFFMRIGNTNGNSGAQISTAGAVTLVAGAGSASASLGTVSVDTWYRLDFLMDTSTGTASIKGRLATGDGAGGTEQTSSVAQVSLANTEYRIGFPASTTAEVFFEDHLLGDASTDYPFGPGTVESSVLTGDGTHSFTAGDFAYDTAGANIATNATDVWTKVGGLDMTSTAALVRQAVIRSTGYLEVAFGTAPHTWDALAVNVISAFHAASTTADTMGAKLNDGGTIKTLTNEAGTGLGDYSQTTVCIVEKVLTAPPSGGTWTASKLGALKARGGYSDDVTPNPYWDGVMLEIAYGPAPASAASLIAAPRRRMQPHLVR